MNGATIATFCLKHVLKYFKPQGVNEYMLSEEIRGGRSIKGSIKTCLRQNATMYTKD